ncbi:MAG TPA: NAD(P)-dependent oxidoreductase [Acidimicrobiales bacterium]|nr:NAD(P)-dependent oxidoreductase [Acidimicrobiales bacterium]
MRVFLLGGTGAIGRHALPALVAAGHEVSALVRTAEKAAAVKAQSATPVLASIFDRAVLFEAVRNHEAVVNLATSMPSTAAFAFRHAWEPTERVRIGGSAAVVDAALAAGVPRLVQESVSMIYPDSGDQWIDEDTLPDRYPNTSGNLGAEASAQRFTKAGGTGVILRLGLFYGPGARHSEQFLAMARHHVTPLMGHPESYVSSIDVADGGAAVVAALQVPAGVYNVVDDEPLTKREYAQALATAASKRPWLRGPGRLALLLGNRLTSLTRSLRVSNRRFCEISRWQPRYPSARQGWVAMAESIYGASPNARTISAK